MTCLKGEFSVTNQEEPGYTNVRSREPVHMDTLVDLIT